jgi:predicted unusual protein kinase regulating ubiquinone biosynthesis (AarF/ABC1/UbiB family)
MGMIRKNVNRYSMVPVVQYMLDEFLSGLRFDREIIYTADFSPIKEELVEMIYTQPFNLNADWAYTGKAVGVLIAVISKLNPDFDVYGELKPYIEKALREEIPGLAKRAAKKVMGAVKTASGLPVKIDEFINNFESGYYRFKIDYSELIEEIDRVKTFAVRFTAFLIGLGCCLGALLAYEPGAFRFNLLIGLAVPALFTAVFFRSRVSRKKERIREMLK